MPNRAEGRFYVDCHVDLPYHMMKHAKDFNLSELREGPFTMVKARQAGIRLFCTAIYCNDEYNGKRALGHFKSIYAFIEKKFDEVMLAKDWDDILKWKDRPETLTTILLVENADFLAEEPNRTGELRREGIGIVGLTHAGKNRLADGNSVSYPDGLTIKGKEIVQKLRFENLIIDIAHLHEKCFWQLMRMVEDGIISSHTGIREAYDIPRNLYLEQAREIIQRGGVIGITFNPEMLAEPGRFGVDRMFVHLDTFVQKFGPDGVGIGSDFCGFDDTLIDAKDITGTERLIETMLSAGYDNEAVAKIMGENWLRLFENYLGS
jgi:membrane dipeptidase